MFLTPSITLKMEDSLTVRLDEVEQELVHLLSLRSDDLQIFSSRQDQLLQSHYHSMTSTLQTAQGQLEKLKSAANVLKEKKEINERWLERQNLKKLWVYCEEFQRRKLNENTGINNVSSYNTSNVYYNNDTIDATSVYQTPNTNDSTTNIRKTSLTNLYNLSLD